MRRKMSNTKDRSNTARVKMCPEGFGCTEIQVTQGEKSFQKWPDCTGVTGKEQWANRDRNKHSRLLRKVFMEYFKHKGFPGGSVEKNRLPVQKTQEMQVWSLDGEEPLEEELATHSSTPAWKTAWTEEPGGLQSQTQLSDWVQRRARVHTHTHTHRKYRKSS